MNFYLLMIIALWIGNFVLDSVADLLHLRNFDPRLPTEFSGIYDESRYQKALSYQQDCMRFGLIRRFVLTALTLLFLLAGGFNAVDLWARARGFGILGTGLLFTGALVLLRGAVSLPFSIYETFGLEARYGFNQTTPKVFALDLIKATILGGIFGGVAFAGVIWFFDQKGPQGWLWAWIGLSAFQLIVTFIAPAVIMPLFNRFEPLLPGELREAISQYAMRMNFALGGVYTMDGSKRSTKANAFFTGFGKLRKIVLFDTLIDKHSTDEIVAVLAHEIGHFKLHHIIQSVIQSIVISGFLLKGLSLLMDNSRLFAAFQVTQVSTYAGLIFASFLFSPVMRVISIFTHWMSRRHEYEADRFAAQTYGNPEALISALKKLSADNLSHLTPHWLKIALEYTHPPVLLRVAALRNLLNLSLLILVTGTISAQAAHPTKQFGLGAILGEPTGITAKLWENPTQALDGGAAYSFDKFFTVYGDYLFHSPGFFKGSLPALSRWNPYWGIGAVVRMGNDVRFAARVPFGMERIFTDPTVGFFVELVPGLQLAPSTNAILEGGIGIRYYF